MSRTEHFTGAVLIARDGRAIGARGYGDSVAGKPNNSDTAFHVASVTKQFTAAAVMQLVESGQVNLIESINAYLPEQ
jgi:CubicO group peptidase (beta-lactamase class C family)